MKKRFFSKIGLWRDERGLALIEFALLLPLLLVFIVGAVELTRYVIINQKVTNASHSLADYVSQVPNPKNLTVSNLNSTLDALLGSYAAKDVKLIVTGIERTADDENPMVTWQKTEGTAGGASKIGVVGGTADAAGIETSSGDFLIGLELYYTHRNILSNIGFISSAIDGLNGKQIYSKSILRYRWDAAKSVAEGEAQTPMPPTGCCGSYCTGTGGNDLKNISWDWHLCRNGETCDLDLVARGYKYRGDAVCNPPPNPDPDPDPNPTPYEPPACTSCACNDSCNDGGA